MYLKTHTINLLEKIRITYNRLVNNKTNKEATIATNMYIINKIENDKLIRKG